MVGTVTSGRPGGNPDIKKHGKKFKKGHKPANAKGQPKEGLNAGSYREQLRYLARQHMDANPDLLDQELKRLALVGSAKGKAPITRIVALRMIERTIKKMEPALLAALIENTEGKMPQEIVLPSLVKAPTEFKTVEEAAAAYKEFMNK